MKKEYQTKQMNVLLRFLKDNSDKHFTVYEITENICFGGLGKSTVYRLIGRLVDNGKVRRFLKNGTKQFVYQYVDCNCSHLHLKCVDCGKIIHLDTSVSEQLESKIFNESGFSIDGGNTMLYGKCKECVIV